MLGWIRDTKRVYDATLFNSYVGTAETTVGKQSQTITLPTVADDAEAQARMQAQTIAEAMANILVELTDVSRDYNDYGHLRSYNEDDIIVVWSSNWVNKIKKLDLPTMFHNEGLVDKFGEYVLPSRYFGKVNAAGGTAPASNTTVRSLIETDYEVSEQTYHVFPGDLLPANATYTANTTYTVDDTIAFKMMYRRSVPMMSSFEAGSSFLNPKSLTENHYLTWGHNTLEYLKNYPFVTVRAEEG